MSFEFSHAPLIITSQEHYSRDVAIEKVLPVIKGGLNRHRITFTTDNFDRERINVSAEIFPNDIGACFIRDIILCVGRGQVRR